MYKVLFHLNEEVRAEGAFRNIENLLEDIGEENIKVRLVVHSKGVYPFKKDRNVHHKVLMSLIDKGVEIAVCTNTLENLHLKLDDFIPGVELVSSAVAEIVRKEGEGWLYIKP